MQNYIVYKRLLKNPPSLFNKKNRKSIILPKECFYPSQIEGEIKIHTRHGNINLPSSVITKLLENKTTYYMIEKFLKRKNSKRLTLLSIDTEGNLENEIEFSKAAIVTAITDVILEDKNNPQKSNLIKGQNLINLVSYKRFLKDRGEEIVSYKSYRGTYSSNKVTISELLSLPKEELLSLFEKDIINGIPGPEFLELINETFKYGTELENYLFPDQIIENKYMLEEKIDNEVICFDNSEQPLFSKDIVINEMLWNEVWDKVPEEFNQLEKAYYIYYQLCKIFTFDEEAFVNGDERKSSIVHNIERLKLLNKDNWEVLCYEFAAIYSKFLEALQLPYNIAGGTTYGPNHIYIEFAYDNYYIIADSTKTLINSDLSLAKRGKDLSGFVLLSTHKKNTKEKFHDELENVKQYIKREEDNERFATLLEIYKSKYKTEHSKLTFEEKKQLYLESITKNTLKTIDSIGYILDIQSVLFPTTETKFCQTCFIKDSIPPLSRDKDSALAAVIYFNEDENNSDKNTQYFLYRPESGIESITKLELQEKFASKQLSFIRNGYNSQSIPGIKKEGDDNDSNYSRRHR